MRAKRIVLIHSRYPDVAGELRQLINIRMPGHRAYVVGECIEEIADRADCFVVDRDPDAVHLLARHGKGSVTIDVRPQTVPSPAGYLALPGDWPAIHDAILNATARKRDPKPRAVPAAFPSTLLTLPKGA